MYYISPVEWMLNLLQLSKEYFIPFKKLLQQKKNTTR